MSPENLVEKDAKRGKCQNCIIAYLGFLVLIPTWCVLDISLSIHLGM